MLQLNQLGWSNFFEEQFTSFKDRGMIPARISAEHKERYMVYSEAGELKAEVTGKLIYGADNPSQFPKTGDWVAGIYFEDEKKLIIHDILERRTFFSRSAAGKKSDEQIIAANIDFLFIVQSMDADLSERRLERYLSSAFNGRIKPVIILNKSDLVNDHQEKIIKFRNAFPDVEVFGVSCLQKTGLSDLNKFIKPGITIACAGSSGVGKSTLINAIAGKNIQKTAEVRSTDSKGRHTTTVREMFLLPQGGILIDTPGMREFGLWNASDGVSKVFDEIELFAENCRFNDCTHTIEVDCAVIAALNSGAISRERYNSYLKLLRELRYLEQKTDLNAMLEEKRKWKIIHKEQKRFLKDNTSNKY